MASQKITLDVGTTYNGQGMQKALGAVNSMSRAAGQAASAVGSLGGQLEGMSGQAGQAVGAVSRLLGALAMGGPLGLAVAGVTALVGAFQALSEEEEKARQEMEKARYDAAKRAIDGYQQSVTALASSLDKAAKNQATFANTLAAIGTSQASVAATNAMIAGEQGGDAVSRAVGSRNATAITQAQIVKTAATAAANAQTNLRAKTSASSAQSQAVRRLEEYVANAQANYDKLSRNLDPTDEEQRKAVTTAAKLLSRAEKNLADARDKEAEMSRDAVQAHNDYVRSLEALQAARAKAQYENLRAENAVTEAKKKAEEERIKKEEQLDAEDEKAREEGVKATWTEVAARVERNDKFRAEERAENQLRESIAKDAALQNELNAATEDLRNAELDYAAALRRAQTAGQNSTWQGWASANGMTDQVIGNGINGTSRYGARNNASIHDAGYNARVAAGMERNAQSQGYGLSARDRKELNRLEMKGDDIGDADRRRRAELRARDPEWQKGQADKRAQAAKDALDAAKERRDAAEQAMQRNVAEIKRMMERLGLK